MFAAGIVGGLQLSNDNVVLDGEQTLVENNVSTTAIENITANCIDLFAYNNDTSHTRFVVRNNRTTLPAYTVTFYVTPAEALVTVYSGDNVVSPTASGAYELADGSYTYTVALEGYTTINGSFTVAGQDLDITEVLSPVTYEMVDENGNDYENDYVFAGSDLILKSTAPYTPDGFARKDITMVKGTDYLVTEGSIKVTLKSDFLSTLDAGVYTLNIHHTEDAYVSGTFLIAAANAPVHNPPKTGDSAQLGLWFALLCISSLTAAVVSRKKVRG